MGGAWLMVWPGGPRVWCRLLHGVPPRRPTHRGLHVQSHSSGSGWRFAGTMCQPSWRRISSGVGGGSSGACVRRSRYSRTSSFGGRVVSGMAASLFGGGNKKATAMGGLRICSRAICAVSGTYTRAEAYRLVYSRIPIIVAARAIITSVGMMY